MHDYAIIGSGVSGGRIAYELTKAGASCVLIEAGREYGASTFPRDELDYSTQLFWNGGLEISADGRLGFLRAKCLGGTSVVNQALLDRFDSLAWDDWKSRSGVGFFSVEGMESHYDACESGITLSKYPEKQFNKNAKIFIQAFEKLGHEWKPLERASGDCKLEHGTDCIVCLGGCPRDSKQSALVTTIRWARDKGLRIESEFEVDHLDYQPDRVKILGSQRGEQREVVARKAVLAAGALGNSKILIRSGFKKSLPAIGTGFSCHPQFMTYAMFDEPVDAHKGAFQTVKSDDLSLRRAGFKLENVYAPPVGTAMLVPGYGRGHQRVMKKYRYMASMEVAIRDDPSGVVTLGGGGKIKIGKSLTSSDRQKAKNGLELVRSLFRAAGAKEIISCTQGFGLHLMGGCAIGTDPKSSVVDPEFRLHGYPGIFAADSSVFPSAPGINPSFTIMALSHRASQSILR